MTACHGRSVSSPPLDTEEKVSTRQIFVKFFPAPLGKGAHFGTGRFSEMESSNCQIFFRRYIFSGFPVKSAVFIFRHAFTQTKITWKTLKISLQKKSGSCRTPFHKIYQFQTCPPLPGGPRKKMWEKMCKTFCLSLLFHVRRFAILCSQFGGRFFLRSWSNRYTFY